MRDLELAPTARGYEALAPDATTAVGITSSLLVDTQSQPVQRVVFTVETQAIRYRCDGADPTSSIGMPVAVGTTVTIDGYTNIKRLKFISQTPSASIKLTVYV